MYPTNVWGLSVLSLYLYLCTCIASLFNLLQIGVGNAYSIFSYVSDAIGQSGMWEFLH